MNHALLSKIYDRQQENRDRLVDELNDLVENNQFDEGEQAKIAKKLLVLLIDETNDAVFESVLNLLGGIYASGICVNAIASNIAGFINTLKPESLVHAIPIIAESNLPEKRKLLEPFLNSSHPAIDVQKNNLRANLCYRPFENKLYKLPIEIMKLSKLPCIRKPI
ncbi:MAG: hypothetical protein DRR16_19525 [Candidatus Parabeggiatoa sp. nov. 3]|nr:MAG: hypothetical protein DRR00_14815 [Gammaproteobacteria bacterium]RKZ60037.1 MAG: hypothetical protein DRQ99_22745 [Gammaproteobacteria bacterium]RKZ82496.1 MAG: hypothetical protein DRR16_19525 [Gammaproteobacteria bacterium]